ncbi:lim domain protein [Planoprotostelium fungivorum]|uniref:Lim domain protein n=1 Tax=Planoprotostelium fungivorum TaxID=1890364 RepID=A0A2P6NZD8_9EUKA|nr:lim domain protein [Planoprotostelium fungivorum]
MKKLTAAWKADSSSSQQQKLHEKMSGSDGVKQQAAELNLSKVQLRDLQQQLEEQGKASNSLTEVGRNLADTLRRYSQNMSEMNANSPLGETLYAPLKLIAINSINTAVTNPIKKMVGGEIKDALALEPKYEKTKVTLEELEDKLKKMGEKSKVNTAKVSEAESERDAAKQNFQATEKETIEALTSANSKINFEILARLVYYLEAQQEYYDSMATKLSALLPELQEYREYIDDKMSEFEREHPGVALERVLQPRAKKVGKNLEMSKSAERAVVSEEEQPIENDPKLDFQKKQRTLQTIVRTERGYLNGLKVIKEEYHATLTKLSKDPKNKVAEEDVNVIFAHIDELYNLHNKLFTELDKASDAFPAISVASIFRAKESAFQVYLQFMNNYAISLDRYDQLKRQNKTVSTALKSTEKNEKPLDAFYESISTRLQQYEIWLEEMLVSTPTTDAEFSQLDEVLHKLTELNDKLKETGGKAGSLTDVMNVQKRLSGFQDELLDTDRKYIREGPLMILEDKGREGQKVTNYYVFLFNDLFIYASKATITDRMAAMRSSRMDVALGNDTYIYKGHFYTNNMQVVNTDIEIQGMKNAFHIVANDKLSMNVGALTNFDKMEWMKALQSAIVDSQAKKVYGVALDTVMSQPGNKGHAVLPVIEKMVTYILNNGINNEGLFRLSGSATYMEETKNLIDRGKDPEWKGVDINAVAGLLKLWLRELPEPLLTFQHYDDWIQVAKKEDKLEALRSARELLPRLPMFNRFHLDMIVRMLVLVSKNADKNKMQPSNLSIIFGPGLMGKKNADPFDTSDYKYVYTIVQMFMLDCEGLFQKVEEEKRNYEDQQQKEMQEKKEQETSDRERDRQSMIEVKKKQEEQVRQQKEDKERKEREDKEKMSNAEITKQREEKEKIELKEENEKNQRIMREREIERDKMLAENHKQLEEERAKVAQLEKERRDEEERRRIAAEKKAIADAEIKKMLEEEQARLRAERENAAKKKAQEKEESDDDDAPECAGCKKKIEDGGIRAANNNWHEECFACSQCGKALQGEFNTKDGKLYCREDYAKLNAKTCGGCGQPIAGPFLKAMNKEWHQACFVCKNCKGSFASGFFEKHGAALCKNCITKE